MSSTIYKVGVENKDLYLIDSSITPNCVIVVPVEITVTTYSFLTERIEISTLDHEILLTSPMTNIVDLSGTPYAGATPYLQYNAFVNSMHI